VVDTVWTKSTWWPRTSTSSISLIRLACLTCPIRVYLAYISGSSWNVLLPNGEEGSFWQKSWSSCYVFIGRRQDGNVADVQVINQYHDIKQREVDRSGTTRRDDWLISASAMQAM